MQRALDELPDEFRLAVVLSDIEELSYKEIADAMGCPIGTVMSRLHRGRRMLQKTLRDHAVALGIVPEEERLPAVVNGDPGSRAERAQKLRPQNEAPADLAAYRARLIERFANPALAHRTRQIAMDGSQKIPQRWLATVRDRLAAGAPIDRLALAVAAWLHFLRGVDEAGQRYTIDDPLAADLAALGNDAQTLCGFAPVFGDLGREPRFVAPVARQLASLRTRGVQATLEALP